MTEEKKNYSIFEKLNRVQVLLKAPKNQYNSFGKYKYRSCEDILEGVKPYLKELNLVLNIVDDVVLIGDRYYVKATARLIDADNGESIETYAYARESESKKGMDSSQVTGATSSYARKYALNGLFAIDDTKDNDFYDNRSQQAPRGQNKKNTTSKKEATPSNREEVARMFDIAKKTNYPMNELKNLMVQKYRKTESDKLTSEEINKLIEIMTQESFA